MSRLPVVFFGHGSPMVALEKSDTTSAWKGIADGIGKPRAILCISAHWETRRTAVTAMGQPRTIHDFGAFPQELFDMQYPAPGDPELAARVAELLAPLPVRQDNDWGLDHGTWTVLCHAYPEADIPVVQLSLDVDATPAQRWEIGKMLRPLRDEGVLIMGTGNIVHNLRMMDWQNPDAEPYPWASRFNQTMLDAVVEDRPQTVIDFANLG
ncbi:MAG: 4,5-DOPA dioxygenase extradiol, partial [Proteobacteria bacterium]